MVVLLDDLHWIDPMSAELLQFLLTMVTNRPIMFVCAQRRQGVDLPNDRLVKVQSLIPTQTIRFRLERLSGVDSETLLAELLSQAELPAPLREAILTQSEGNPYFIEEFVRMLIEQNYLQQHEGVWQLASDLELDDLPLPSSLDTLIRSRIDALPSALKEVMQCAAVVGEPFEADLLQTIMESDNVKAALKRLELRLLIQRGAETNYWVFNHSLIGVVVYNTMLKAQRRMFHLKIAQALEVRWAGREEEHVEVLAHHFSQANEGAKALTYLIPAGERAAARFANEEAMTYFELAAQQLNRQPDAPDDLHWRLAAGLGDVYRVMGRYEESAATLQTGLTLVEGEKLPKNRQASLYRRLGETARKHGNLDAAHDYFSRALTLLEGMVERETQLETARVLIGLAWVYFFQGQLQAAQQACQASLDHAWSADALSELAAAENLLGGIYFRQSDWTSALHHTMRAMVLREQMGYSWGVAGTLSNLGILAVSAGHWSKGRSFFERSLAQRKEMGDVEGVVIVHNNLGYLTRDQGDLEQAEYHFRECLAEATRWDMNYHRPNAILGLAQVLLLKDRLDEAQEALDICLPQLKAISAQELVAESYLAQAEIYLARSTWSEAVEAAEQAAVLAAEEGNRSLEAAAWRVASEVALRQNQLWDAEAFISKAQVALAEVTAELEAGRVAAQVGRIRHYQGQASQADANLRTAKEIFMRLGANLDLNRVKETLNRALS
jgi:tetratricopeptide (TPR) repeat protein